MAEPLLGHRSYVAEWDPDSDELTLRSHTPGPAGSLVIEFDGLVLALDGADPRLLNFIDVPDAQSASAGSASFALLTRLIGAVPADAARALVGSDHDRPQRIEMADGASEQSVPARIARLATAVVGSESAGLLPVERALATMEALTIARNADLDDHLPDAEDRLRRAAHLLLSTPWEQSKSLEVRARSAAADACELAAGWLADDVGIELRGFAERLRTLGGGRRSTTASGSVVEPSRHDESSDASFTPDSLPMLIASREPTVTRTTNDEYEVRIPGWAERAEGWWVRAFMSGGQVPLAAVPMAPDGHDAVAQLLLPSREARQFELDIVDDPGTLRPSSRIAAFRAAIATGQRAARLERLDRRDAAAHAWQRSSDLHRRAGDEDRARQAEVNGQGQRAHSLQVNVPHVAPTVADHCLPIL